MNLENKIAKKNAHVAVIGLGYVGLPLAIQFAREGFPVVGVDIDARKIAKLAHGKSYIPDVPSAEVVRAVRQKRFAATTEFDVLCDADVIFICVPTPFDEMKAPDLKPVIAATESIAPRLQKGQLVILQSTTYPGTTEEVCLPILETSGLKAGKDFHLVFSPERIDPGATSSAGWNVKNTPKVLGGLTPRCTNLAKKLLVHLTPAVHIVSSPRAAEMSKLLENIFRSVNIALVNELAHLAERMDIDIWEVIDAAKTKPFGFMPFYPSAGVGGHCLAGEEFLFAKNGHGLTGIQIGDYFSKLEREYPGAARTINGVTLLEPEGINILSFDLATGELCYKPLLALSRREYRGAMAQVTTHDRRSLRVTNQHPMIVWENHAPRIKRAMDLRAGDELILPTRFPETAMTREIDLIAGLTREEIAKTRVAPRRGDFKTHRDTLTPHLKMLKVEPHEIYRANRMSLRVFLELETRGAMPLARREVMLRTGRGPSANSVPAIISIDENFARLIGYYLSEGCVTRDKSLRTRWTFNSNEHEYIDDLCHILDALEMRYSKRRDRQWNAMQIKVSSNLFGRMIRDVLQCGTRSTEMQIPGILLESAEPIRRALFAGLLRGDGDVFLEQRIRHYQHKAKQRAYDHHINVATVGYFSSSPRLFQQTILLAQGLGFVPTFKKDTPYFRFYGEQQLARLVPFFDGAKRANLESYAAHRRKRMPVKSFAAHDGFATVRVAQVDLIKGPQPVYSAEVEDTHTFVTSFGIVTHNCIPVDPYYLSWKAREYDFFTRFIELAADINQGMPYHVVKLIGDALSDRGKKLRGARVLVLGVAFKPNVDDARNSPAERVIELLLARGVRARYHDPFVPEFRVGADVFHRERVTLKSVPLTRAEIRRSDVVVIVTAHRKPVNYRAVVAHAALIVDTANATKGLGHAEKIVRLGAPQKRIQ